MDIHTHHSYIKAGDKYFKPARPVGRHLRKDAQGLLVVQILKVRDNKVMKEKQGKTSSRDHGTVALNAGTFTYIPSASIARAQLSRQEMIGLRLYTGPAYAALNGALRARRAMFGKLDCRVCSKGKYAIVAGKSACKRKCGTCVVCTADLEGWACQAQLQKRMEGNKVVWHVKVTFSHAESGTELSSEASFADDIKTFCSWVKAPRVSPAVQAFDFHQTHSCSNCAPGMMFIYKYLYI